jgi:transcriptional regulator with XRE-family HTH domain
MARILGYLTTKSLQFEKCPNHLFKRSLLLCIFMLHSLLGTLLLAYLVNTSVKGAPAVRRKDSTLSPSGVSDSHIGQRLRGIREDNNITINSVAKASGYTKGYVSSIETGSRPIPRESTKLIQGYAEALKLSPQEVNALIQETGVSVIEQSNIPYKRNSFFAGRDEEIKHIHSNLMNNVKSPNICAITGISGIGKTSVAVEYAFHYREEYKFVLWIQADTPDTLSAHFTELAKFLNFPEDSAQDRKTTISIIKQWLQAQDRVKNSRCLLIFDNADEISVHEDLLYQLGSHHVILTTRTQLLEPTIQNVELMPISESSSILLLLRQSHLVSPKTEFSEIPGTLRIDAQRIVSILGRLPFALSQAAIYIRKTKCGLSYYLKILQLEQNRILEEDSTPATRATTATWSLSFRKIRENNPEAAVLLHFCAFLYPDMIYKEFLLDASPVLTSKLRAVTSSRKSLEEAIRELLRYSLVQVNARTGALSLHRLVQTTIRNGLPTEEQQRWAEYVVRAINLVFPLIEVTTLHISWRTCQRYFYQARACANLIEQWKIANHESRQFLHKFGKYLAERTEFKNAEHVYQLALDLDKQAERGSNVIIGDLYMFAQFYQMRGNHKRSEEYYKQALLLYDTESPLDNYRDLFADYRRLLKSMNKLEEIKKLQEMTKAAVIDDSRDIPNRRVINDTDEDIKYDGVWTYQARRWGDHSNDAHITNQSGASFQCVFVGYGIEILADPSSFEGEIDIFIDGDYVQTISSVFFEGEISQTHIFSDVRLGQAEHMIEGKLVSGTFTLDALAVYSNIAE